MPARFTRTSTAPAARWRTASRSASSISSPTARRASRALINVKAGEASSGSLRDRIVPILIAPADLVALRCPPLSPSSRAQLPRRCTSALVRPICPQLVALGRIGPSHEAPQHHANSHHHRASPSDQHPVDQRHSNNNPHSARCSTRAVIGTSSGMQVTNRPSTRS